MNLATQDGEQLDDEKENMYKVVWALQEAFAHMMNSYDGVYNLANFVELLGLNSGEQQDPQEFNKLFFAKIETLNLPVFNDEKPSLNALITGKERYSTVCSYCKHDSGSNHDFHELDLSIAGFDTLDMAIANYMAGETLDGENQYQCSKCNKRRDAERCTKLTTLPDVLCIHLLRYTYDKKTLAKKKLQSDLTFPSLLTIKNEEYQLVAVLYHKGRSAHGGHYVCDALDWSSGEWWHCDDDHVVLTTNPADFPPVNSHAASNEIAQQQVMDLVDNEEEEENSSVKPKSKGKQGGKGAYNEENEAEWIENGAETNKRKGDKKSAPTPNKKAKTAEKDAVKESGKDTKGKGKKDDTKDEKKEEGSSEYDASTIKKGAAGKNANKNVNPKREAYMLSYVRKTSFDKAVKMEQYDFIQPHIRIVEQIEASSDLFKAHIAEHEAKCDKIMQHVEDRKALVRSILPDLVPKEKEMYHLVPAEWLTAFIRGDPSTLPPLDDHSGDVVNMVTEEDSGPVVSDTESVICCSSSKAKSASSSSRQSTRHVKQEATHKTSNAADNAPRIKTVDTMSFLCEHGTGIRVSDLDKFKLISDDAFRAIFDEGEKDPSKRQTINYDFTSNNIRCDLCYNASVGANQGNSKLLDEMSDILALLDAPLDEKDWAFLVPKSWLTSFRKYHEMLTTCLLGKGKRSAVEIVALIHGGSFAEVSQISVEDTAVDSTTGSVNGDAADSASHTPPPSSSSSSSRGRNVVDLSGGGGKSKHPDVVDLRDNDTAMDVLAATAASEGDKGTMDGWLSGGGTKTTIHPLDNTITGALQCAHKNYSSAKKSQGVSFATWSALVALYPQAVEVTARTLSCKVCKKDAESRGESKEKAKQVRRLELEIDCLNTLSKSKQTYNKAFDAQETLMVSVEAKDSCLAHKKVFNLIDGAWMARWRYYLKNNDVFRPDVADCVQPYSKLWCEHDKALVPVEFRSIPEGLAPNVFDPASLLVGSLESKRDDGCPTAELISNAQWRELITFDPDKAYRVLTKEYGLNDEDDSPYVNTPGITLKWDEDRGVWRYDPEVCLECLDNLKSRTEQAKIKYDNECISVRVYRDQEKFAQAISSASTDSTAAEGGGGGARPTRTCKRSSAFKSVSVCVSSSDDISLVKLKLMQVVDDSDLAPSSMRLYNEAGVELDTHHRTLSYYKFKACDTLLVLRDETAGGDEDLMFAYHEAHTMRGGAGKEGGFGGSVLTGGGGNKRKAANSAGTSAAVISSSSSSSSSAKNVVDLDETQFEGEEYFDAMDVEESAAVTTLHRSGSGLSEGVEEVDVPVVHSQQSAQGMIVNDDDEDEGSQDLLKLHTRTARAGSMDVDEMYAEHSFTHKSKTPSP
eukprot:gene24623-30991_t